MRRIITRVCLLLTLAVGASVSAANETTSADYVLQPSDLIRVQIFQEDDLTREVRVSQESSVSLPLIGTIDLRGNTIGVAQERIRALYAADYLVNPQVNIIVVEYSKRTVNVLGSVNAPGSVPFPPEQGMNLVDAIARAGGFNRLADRKRVKLTRVTDGKTENFIINADEIIQGNTTQAWQLQKDDVIYVPERVL
ncbi:MAG: polysaccharide export protein [Opitutus sp.]|nr:polysaccharide export protein [Opitutus sp.]